MKKINNKSIRELIRNKYSNHCAYCGCFIGKDGAPFTIDHIIPLRRGDKVCPKGINDIINFNPCCASCNSSKSTFSIEKWREEISKKYQRLIRDSSQVRLLIRFGMIRNHNEVIFYFEKHEANIL